MFFIDFISSILIAMLAGMGVGGGGLLVIYLTLVKDIGQIQAQGINLLFFIAAGISASFINLKSHKFKPSKLLIMIISGAAGAVLGSILTVFIKSEWLRATFGIFLLVSGTIELFSKKEKYE